MCVPWGWPRVANWQAHPTGLIIQRFQGSHGLQLAECCACGATARTNAGLSRVHSRSHMCAFPKTPERL